MSSSDLGSSCSVRQALDPKIVASAAAFTGNEIDTFGYRWALVIFNYGVIGGGTASGVVRVQGAETSGGSFVNLNDAAMTILDADDNTVKVGLMDLQHSPRYLKLSGTAAEAGNNFLASTFVLYGPTLPNLPELISGGADELTFTALNP